jgi:hypothetical protein
MNGMFHFSLDKYGNLRYSLNSVYSKALSFIKEFQVSKETAGNFHTTLSPPPPPPYLAALKNRFTDSRHFFSGSNAPVRCVHIFIFSQFYGGTGYEKKTSCHLVGSGAVHGGNPRLLRRREPGAVRGVHSAAGKLGMECRGSAGPAEQVRLGSSQANHKVFGL